MPRTPRSTSTRAQAVSASPRKRKSAAVEGSTTDSAPPAQPSASDLLHHSVLTTDEWFKSKNTRKAYANYVKSGKAWLAKWVSEGRKDIDAEPASPQSSEAGLGVSEERSIFAGAFDKIDEHTPTALHLLMAYKCDYEKHGYSTAEGLRSAFKEYFELVHNCQGEYWRYNAHTKQWEGCPVFQVELKAYYDSLRKRDGKMGTSTQALPMLPKDLKVLTDWLDGPDAVQELKTETKRLYMKAFMTTAFCLWTRNDELINLLSSEVATEQVSQAGRLYHEFKLTFRKTNQDHMKSQVYRIPPDPTHPEIDCYTHMSTWLAHLQSLLGRPLAADDYIFPAIASTGRVKFGEPTSRTAIETLLDTIVDKSGLMADRRGKFTTHCFRRGGAQYRFMWAEGKYSLKAVKWWGGWSSSKNVGTIMRYLLDELMAYEEGFSDILMEDRLSERHEMFMGAQDLTLSVSKGDLAVFGDELLQRVTELILATPRHVEPVPQILSHEHPLSALELHSRTSPISDEALVPPLSTPSSLTPATNVSSDIPPPSLHMPLTLPPTSTVPLHPSSLGPGRIPTTHSLDDALRYWDEGDPQKGLLVPLREWSTRFRPGDYRPEAQKLSMIEKVRHEFMVHHNGDMDSFITTYPNLRYQYTKLVAAVREARIQRGEAKQRGRHHSS